jgi:hypothetical protein
LFVLAALSDFWWKFAGTYCNTTRCYHCGVILETDPGRSTPCRMPARNTANVRVTSYSGQHGCSLPDTTEEVTAVCLLMNFVFNTICYSGLLLVRYKQLVCQWILSITLYKLKFLLHITGFLNGCGLLTSLNKFLCIA